MRKRAMDHGICFGDFKQGPFNNITDVPGVMVGHTTLKSDTPQVIRTGVTVILPSENHIYSSPFPAAAAIINGFGKSAGIVQINELGKLETPIVLTNTLATGTAFEALVEYSIAKNPGLETVNPVVGECNDSYLSDIRQLSVTRQDVLSALADARTGGKCSHGSGEITIAFSTANRVPQIRRTDIYPVKILNEKSPIISDIFSAVIDCIEEAIIDSLLTAETTHGVHNRVVQALPVEALKPPWH